MTGEPRWWDARRTHSTKPSSYTCPLCGGRFPAMSEHMLLFPEGDGDRRRHAHIGCVLRARQAGTLPTREEWRADHEPARPKRGRWGWLPRRRGAA